MDASQQLGRIDASTNPHFLGNGRALGTFVHYVPMAHDGSNAEEMVRWILDNDEKAQRIAERATHFMEDMLYHPDAEKDEQEIKRQIMKRYQSHWSGRHVSQNIGSDQLSQRDRGGGHRKAFVCITGQLSRLELANKVRNLFRPWVLKYDVEFDVALVLSDTNHSSLNRPRDQYRDQLYFSVADVVDDLTKLPGVTVLNTRLSYQPQHPIVNPQYVAQRNASSHDKMTSAQLLHRVQNHIRQFQSISDCFRYMTLYGSPQSYDIIHRIREDSGYTAPIDFPRILDLVSRQDMTIISSACETQNGINDRGSFVSPRAAYDYFTAPLISIYTKPLPLEVNKTETFLLYVYGQTSNLIATNSFQIIRLYERRVPNASSLDTITSPEIVSYTNAESYCIEGLKKNTKIWLWRAQIMTARGIQTKPTA